MKASIKFDTKKFESSLKKIGHELSSLVFRWLNHSGEYIKLKTTPYVPVDGAFLIYNFQKSVDSSVGGRSYNLSVRYSGNNPRSKGYDYAWIQHEKYPNKRYHGEMKYLEKGMSDAEQQIFQNLINEIDRKFTM